MSCRTASVNISQTRPTKIPIHNIEYFGGFTCHRGDSFSLFHHSRSAPKPCDVELLVVRCCLARGNATSAPASSDTAPPSSDFQLAFFLFPSVPPPTYNKTTATGSLAMYRTRSGLVYREPSEEPGIARTPPSGQAYREPEEAPVPPIALNRMASAEIPGLEQVWADSDAPAHRFGSTGRGRPAA
jgi:hypothetical protein